MPLRLFGFSFLIILFLHNSFAQNDLKSNVARFPGSFLKVNNSSDSFKINSPYYIAQLILNNDGLFRFYQASPAGYRVCMGYYKKTEKLLNLAADSLMSYKLINDTNLCTTFFRFKRPQVFIPQPEIYYFTSKGIESQTIKFDKIEVLISTDLKSKNVILDSLISIQFLNFPFKQEQIVLKRLGHSDLIFKKDSIWGFRLYKNGDFTTYRIDPIGLKWNVFPGMRVEQVVEGFVVYSIESTSKDRYYYFSKELDTPAFVMNSDNIKKEYEYLPCFTAKVKKSPFPLNHGQINEKTKNLKITDLYTDCVLEAEKAKAEVREDKEAETNTE
ncbi:MAG: hypothetical protein J0L69_04160 [Bacteroidetes bacterium]|nr:hypothetical protein [Bacteroidota bacterium]